MVSLDCNMVGVSFASSSHIAIHSTAPKIQQPVRKILLLGALTLKCCSQMDIKLGTGKDQRKGPPDNQKGPMGLIKGLIRRPFIEKLISNDFKGPWEPCE